MAMTRISQDVLDLEKDAASIHSATSHTEHDTEVEDEDDSHVGEEEHHDVQYMPMTAKSITNQGSHDAAAPHMEKSRPAALRVLSRTSSKSSWRDPGPPPNGGSQAWIQVFCAHLIVMCTWGLINSFGVFQTYYVSALARSPSDISWIGSFQVFLTFFIGTFTGRATDAGYFRSVFAIGSLLSVLGIMMASLSTSYYQLFLAQGVCLGLGSGCLFCPMLALVSTYFSTKRSLALGIAACGSATGGLIFPAMVQNLLPTIGFGWTMRAIGFVVLGCLVLCNLLARRRVPPRTSGPIVEWAAFREMTYTLYALGMFLNFWGVYFAFFYIGSYARNIIGLPYDASINLILVLNGLGFLGRLLPNFLADRLTGPINILVPVTFICSLIMFAMIAVDSATGLYIWATFYGITGAAIQSLFPAALSSLTTDLRKAGVRMGMVFTIVSFAVLTGPPIAGALITSRGGEYGAAQAFAGASMAAAGLTLAGSRFARTGWRWRVKM